MARQRIVKDNCYRISPKESKFIDLYIEYSDGGRAVQEAGYTCKNPKQYALVLLDKEKIQRELKHRLSLFRNEHIANTTEIMQYLTDVMRGNVKDQFGLDATIADRTKAAQELAKRIIDTEKIASNSTKNEVVIKLDWNRDTPAEVED